MNLSFLRTCIIELKIISKHARCLHYLGGSRNVLMSFRSTNTRTNLYDFSPKLYNINKFFTGDILLKSKDRPSNKKSVVHVNLNEISDIVKVERMMSQFDGAIEKYKDEMVKNLAVRTRVGAVEELTITFEDEEHNLEELVDISRKPNMILLNASAFPQIIPNILEVLSKSNMNLNPQQDGTTIYIPLPKVTKEHRESLAKTAKQYFVKCKNIISDIRNEHIRNLKKKEGLPKDLTFKAESYISALQKQYVDKAEELLKAKQKELLGES
ncbi:mitochondrial ribosome recycling factor 1 [Bombus vancouverensis nearcticus]|uniref:mitochondrial ribosome recycling factor 1 n=1 Tax=Bombus vancouverensis nearcticus TaxID=2705178 RepID=UPI00143AD153|nr:ribosome-recycling factor, mitochondrial [Bombus vancouverensis nearcticus]